MTAIQPEIDDDETGNEDEGTDEFRQMRRKANKADKLATDNVSLARENAFLKAGIDVNSPLAEAVMKGYDGDLDPEAIKVAFPQLLPAPAVVETTETPEVIEDEGSTTEREALAAGATSDTGQVTRTPAGGKDGRAVKAADDVLAAGAPREDAAGAAFGELVGAAIEGDRSVILPHGGGVRE